MTRPSDLYPSLLARSSVSRSSPSLASVGLRRSSRSLRCRAHGRAFFDVRRGLFCRRKPEPGRARRSRQPLGAGGLLERSALLNVYLPAYADQKEFRTIDATPRAGSALRFSPPEVRRGSGRSTCSCDRFSGLVAIHRGHKLVTGGIYSVIRHPSYLGLLLNSLGCGLAFRSRCRRAADSALTVVLAHRADRCVSSGCCIRISARNMTPDRARTSRLIPGPF